MSKDNKMLVVVGVLLLLFIFFSIKDDDEKKLAPNDLSRALPASVDMGGTFSLRYEVEAPSPPFFYSIKDTITGGCTVFGSNEIVTTLTSPASFSEITITAPSSAGECIFSGDWKLGSGSEIPFQSGSVSILGPSCTPSTVTSDCGVDTNCLAWSCPSGECVSNIALPGTSCGVDSVCDNSGICIENVECNSVSDCDDRECQTTSCVIGTCTYTAVNDDTECTLSVGGLGVCSSGACIQCSNPEDCAADTECRNYFCSSNTNTCDFIPNTGSNCVLMDSNLGQCNSNGICVTVAQGTCVPDCEGKVCGPDGCTGTCGSGCSTDETCSSGACIDKPPKCEVWESFDLDKGVCTLAGWIYIVIGFMALAIFINIVTK